MNKRKIIIGGIAFIAVVVIFGIYNLIVDTPEISYDNNLTEEKNVEIPDFESQAGQIGVARVAEVGRSEYITRDKETKQIKRILGFEKLEDPAKGSDLWRLVNPYMKILGDSYECDIRSAKGTIRVQNVMGDAIPSMAELTDDVEIVITTNKDNRRITVSLDDLVYDNERCEFSSDGPVKVTGDDGVMEGTGMILIYDSLLGKLAYLEILKLKYLTIKNVVKNGDEPAPAAGTKSDRSSVAASPAPAKQQPVAADRTASSSSEQPQSAESEKYKYYQCRLLDNVNIEYGKRLVIVGADDVTISNILWSESKSEDKQAKKTEPVRNESAAGSPAAESAQQLADTSPASSQQEETSPAETAELSGDKDVYVTCNGSLIIRPMELAGVRPDFLSKSNNRRMDLVGRPVRIGQLVDRSSEEIEPIASCGAMSYDIDRQVLDLVTNNTERYVELNMTQNQANIYTEGSVKWNRRDNNAVITGPGTLLVDETAAGGNTSDLKFDGAMNIFFADKKLQDFNQQLSLSSVNLVGGMVANISRHGNATVSSDMANFQFEGGKQIAQIDLNGNVDMTSDTGNIKSSDARIFFAKDDTDKNVPVRMSASGNAVMEPKQISSQRPTRFHAQKIDYDMLTGSALATGPVKFIFYVPDEKGSVVTDEEKVPVIITAEDSAKFYPVQNQFVFNGDVVGTRLTQHPDFVQRDAFYGDQLIVDIAQSKDDQTKDDIDHVRVIGGVVELRSKRMAGELVVGHIGLSCMQIDYDTAAGTIIAKGPGEILINNKDAPEPANVQKSDSSFNLSGPCQASIGGFDTLKWDTLNNAIFADGGSGAVNIGYLPIKNGRRGQIVRAASRYITSRFVPTAEGKFDIASLDARDGIVYEEVGLHKMMGDSMHYGGEDGIMVIKGTSGEDCIVDGARMPQVEYNMKTGKISSTLSSRPGTITIQ